MAHPESSRPHPQRRETPKGSCPCPPPFNECLRLYAPPAAHHPTKSCLFLGCCPCPCSLLHTPFALPESRERHESLFHFFPTAAFFSARYFSRRSGFMKWAKHPRSMPREQPTKYRARRRTEPWPQPRKWCPYPRRTNQRSRTLRRRKKEPFLDRGHEICTHLTTYGTGKVDDVSELYEMLTLLLRQISALLSHNTRLK